MSKISVTTIAGLTSGGDANKVKIESGDSLNVVSGDLTVDTNVLHVDSSNNRVGIGTTSPDNLLHIKTTGSTPSIELEQDSGTSYKGLIKLAGNDLEIRGSNGQLEFYNGSQDGDSSPLVMKSDASGRITKPLQPAFSATATTTNVPLTTQTTVTLSSPRFNVGSHLSGNTFTAPITGKYLFTYLFYFTQLDASHTTLDVHIKTSNKQYQQTWNPSAFMGSDSNFSVSGSQICDMDANDTTYFAVYVSGGGAQTDIHGDSQVSGCLLL